MTNTRLILQFSEELEDVFFIDLQAIVISLGNKCDLKESKQVDFNTANKWAQKEKGIAHSQ